jgi:putative ABC transport system permease protein
MLTLGSAIFIAVMNVYASLVNTLDEALDYYGFDLGVFFSKEYRTEQILNETNRIPGVNIVETWGITDTRIVNDDGSESNNITFVAPPLNTKLIRPTVLRGRWLNPEDENAVVVNTDVLREKPDLRIGDQISLKIDGSDSLWEVVGITRSVMQGPWIYTNYPYFARRLGKYGLASAAYVSLDLHDPKTQTIMAKKLEDHFDRVGLQVSTIGKVVELRASAIRQFNLILFFLLFMAVVLTIVGGLGLAGTMSLNVLERTREIGVLRAIGASNSSILKIVLIEGILIGLMSWFLGVFFSLPFSSILNRFVGQGFLRSPLNSVFSYNGAIVWVFILLIISTFASLLPALNATRIAVRDVLAYE